MRVARLDVVRGSGNVYRDLKHVDADVEQSKAILAAQIIKALNRQRLSARATRKRTGLDLADISRIRNADLARFTLDRLMSITNKLGFRIEMKIRLRPARSEWRSTQGKRGSFRIDALLSGADKMPIVPHDKRIEPPDDAEIWRFLKLAHFRNLMANEELFSRDGLLQDGRPQRGFANR